MKTTVLETEKQRYVLNFMAVNPIVVKKFHSESQKWPHGGTRGKVNHKVNRINRLETVSVRIKFHDNPFNRCQDSASPTLPSLEPYC